MRSWQDHICVPKVGQHLAPQPDLILIIFIIVCHGNFLCAYTYLYIAIEGLHSLVYMFMYATTTQCKL